MDEDGSVNVRLHRMIRRGTSYGPIVPDGVLYTVPFELLAERAGAPLLIEQAAVSYLPSAALLLRRDPARASAYPWQRQLIGFGDPAVNAAAAQPPYERWSPLPESARELRSIARVLPGAAQLHTGPDDLKRHLLENRAPLLHLSTHAVADAKDPQTPAVPAFQRATTFHIDLRGRAKG